MSPAPSAFAAVRTRLRTAAELGIVYLEDSLRDGAGAPVPLRVHTDLADPALCGRRTAGWVVRACGSAAGTWVTLRDRPMPGNRSQLAQFSFCSTQTGVPRGEHGLVEMRLCRGTTPDDVPLRVRMEDGRFYILGLNTDIVLAGDRERPVFTMAAGIAYTLEVLLFGKAVYARLRGAGVPDGAIELVIPDRRRFIPGHPGFGLRPNPQATGGDLAVFDWSVTPVGPKSPCRLGAIGDSITAGNDGEPEAESYVHLVTRALGQEDVLNTGSGGSTTALDRGRFAFEIAPFCPAIAWIEGGPTTSAWAWMRIPPGKICSRRRRLSRGAGRRCSPPCRRGCCPRRRTGPGSRGSTVDSRKRPAVRGPARRRLRSFRSARIAAGIPPARRHSHHAGRSRGDCRGGRESIARALIHGEMSSTASALESFWESTRGQLAREPLDARLEPVPAPLPYKKFKVTLCSLGGVKICGWLALPVRGEGPPEPWPAIVSTPGYGGTQQGVMLGECQRGYAVLQLYPRGQGDSAALWTLPAADKLTWRLEQPEGAYYQGAYADVIRAVDWLVTRPEIDPERVALVGTSQGGGLSLAAGALDGRIRTVVAHVPFLCAFRLAARTPGALVKLLLDQAGCNNEAALRTLSYFDPLQLAPWLRAPVLLSAGGRDEVCPAATIRAVHERLPGVRELHEYPALPHTTCLDFYQRTWPWLERCLRVPAG